jgi:hypothetical protein
VFVETAYNFSLKDFIFLWNKEYPFDYIWRKKYGIAFNSSQHREMNFIDMQFDVLEEQLIQESIDFIKKKKENKENYLITGKWLNKKSYDSITEEEFLKFKING